MVKRLKFLAFILLAMGPLGACETPEPAQELPGISFAHLAAFRFDVAAIDVVSVFKSPLQRPNVEHLFPTPPEAALRQWAADRLQAAGKSGTARFTIVDAAVTETRLKVDKSVTGTFKKEQSERYEASVEARLEVVDSRGFHRGFAGARARRTTTVGEDASLNERERIWFDLVDAVMKDFDAELERNIRQHIAGYLF